MNSPEQLGKYTLVRHLATGGMAEIYLAEQAGPGGFNKELVIKRILPQMAQDDEFVRMFLDEARLVAQLSHPKIAQIYDLGEIDGQYFIAMEFVDGLDLSEVIEGLRTRGEYVPVEVATKILIDLLEALDYAHDYSDKSGKTLGLVHRDISPQNVLLSNDGIVKLVDFGVAKAKQNKSKTQAGAVKGKFAYMAPEQIQSQELDRRADLFAAGVLLFELLTAQKPFGDELTAVTQILTQPHPDPRSMRPDVPNELVAVIDRALEKSREARYEDAHAMVRELEQFARSREQYVGDRELAAFIRNLQGLPTTRHSSQGELAAPVTPPTGGARVTPVENGLPAQSGANDPEQVNVLAATQAGTPLPGDLTAQHQQRQHQQPQHQQPQHQQAQQHNHQAQQPNSPTAEVGAVDQPQGPAPGSTIGVDQIAEPDDGVSAGLVVLFVLLLFGILAAGGGAFFLIAGGNGDSEATANQTTANATTPQDTDKPDKPVVKGNPALLRDVGGLSVTISAKPDAEIFVDDKLVSPTPFSTQLKPGKYTIQLRNKSGTRSQSFEVKAGKPIQFFKFKM